MRTLQTIALVAAMVAVFIGGLIYAAFCALIGRPGRPDTREWMVIDPFLKPVYGTMGAKTAEQAITAAERYVGQDWRWMIERGFRLSRG